MSFIGFAVIATAAAEIENPPHPSAVDDHGGRGTGGDRLLSDWLATLNSRFGTPARTIVITGVGIVALVVLGVEVALLAEVASFRCLVTYGLVHVAVVRLRRNDEADDPHFRIPDALYPAVPILGVLATLAIMTRMDPIVIVGGLVLAVAGVAWYLSSVRYRREWRRPVRTGFSLCTQHGVLVSC